MTHPAHGLPPQLFLDDVVEGAEIPPLTVSADPVQLFFFSAATYNAHRIHYDLDWTRDVEGYDDLVVHGPLQVAWMCRALTDWIGGQGRLIRFATQNRGIVTVGEELEFGATITTVRATTADRGEVDLTLHGRKASGDVVLPGTATVSLPRSLPRPGK